MPTYNYNAYFLVEEIHKQLLETNNVFEIICVDDGSQSSLNSENNKINNLSSSRFIELTENIGRSAIRNLLIKESNFNWLLFLDADGFPVSDNFIQDYIEIIKNNLFKPKVFCGGRKHRDLKNSLRTSFGIKREEVLVEKRKKEPYRYFFTSNFLATREIFNEVNFYENLTTYGYEDYFIGKQLEKQGIKVVHIDNPVFHEQIEDNEAFIEKTKQGLENLMFLKKNFPEDFRQMKLLKVFNFFEQTFLIHFLKNKHIYFAKKAVETSLLIYFDLFRISYLDYLQRRKNR
ncbi:glycosyltransferase family A protein [Tenacibaculum sp. IB213877]|uniref:glycosyltransferase family 2 protein n=1 Tax=Tenacibaculum sp. IB213877 TaxID=3097351 RepID=UPI002A59DE8E|nr:glycosyltransferase family A protein [Tenacibaculum sp. IB213877]MDY0780183.1 glycosyltransferase family A protein [Tenacibaculum sp. IB213877]